MELDRKYPEKLQVIKPWLQTVLLAMWSGLQKQLTRSEFIKARFRLATLVIPCSPLKRVLHEFENMFIKRACEA